MSFQCLCVCLRAYTYMCECLAQTISYHYYLYHNKDWGDIMTFYNDSEAQVWAILPLLISPLGPSLVSPNPIPRCPNDGVGPGGTHLHTWCG